MIENETNNNQSSYELNVIDQRAAFNYENHQYT